MISRVLYIGIIIIGNLIAASSTTNILPVAFGQTEADFISCKDGIDNDSDGKIDGADPDCPELCDSIDNDNDGTIDENCPQKQEFCEPNVISLPQLDNKSEILEKVTETGFLPDHSSNGGLFWLSFADKNGTLIDRLIKNNTVVAASTAANLPSGTEKGNTGVLDGGTGGDVIPQPNLVPTAKDVILGGYTKDAVPAATGGNLQSAKKVALVAGIRTGALGNGTNGTERLLIVAMGSQSEKTTTAKLMTVPLSKLGITQNYTNINPLNFLQIISKLLQKIIWVDCEQGGTLYLLPPDPRGNGVEWYKPTVAPNSPLTKIAEIGGGQKITAIEDNIVQFAENECGAYRDANLGSDLCFNPSCNPDVDGFYHTTNACFHDEEGMCDPFVFSRNGECGGHYVPPIEFNCYDDKDDDQDGNTDMGDQDCEGQPQRLPTAKKRLDNVCYYKAEGPQGNLICYSLSDIDKNPCFFYPAGSGCRISKNAAKEGCYDNPVTASNDFCRKQFPNALISMCGGNPDSSFSSYCSLLSSDAETPAGSTSEGEDTSTTSPTEDCSVAMFSRPDVLTRVNYIQIAACPSWWNFPQSSGPIMSIVEEKVQKIEDILFYCFHDVPECAHLLMQAFENIREFSHNTGMTPREIIQYIIIPLLFTL